MLWEGDWFSFSQGVISVLVFQYIQVLTALSKCLAYFAVTVLSSIKYLCPRIVKKFPNKIVLLRYFVYTQFKVSLESTLFSGMGWSTFLYIKLSSMICMCNIEVSEDYKPLVKGLADS